MGSRVYAHASPRSWSPYSCALIKIAGPVKLPGSVRLPMIQLHRRHGLIFKLKIDMAHQRGWCPRGQNTGNSKYNWSSSPVIIWVEVPGVQVSSWSEAGGVMWVPGSGGECWTVSFGSLSGTVEFLGSPDRLSCSTVELDLRWLEGIHLGTCFDYHAMYVGDSIFSVNTKIFMCASWNINVLRCAVTSAYCFYVCPHSILLCYTKKDISFQLFFILRCHSNMTIEFSSSTWKCFTRFEKPEPERATGWWEFLTFPFDHGAMKDNAESNWSWWKKTKVWNETLKFYSIWVHHLTHLEYAKIDREHCSITVTILFCGHCAIRCQHFSLCVLSNWCIVSLN